HRRSSFLVHGLHTSPRSNHQAGNPAIHPTSKLAASSRPMHNRFSLLSNVRCVSRIPRREKSLLHTSFIMNGLWPTTPINSRAIAGGTHWPAHKRQQRRIKHVAQRSSIVRSASCFGLPTIIPPHACAKSYGWPVHLMHLADLCLDLFTPQ